MNALDDLLCSDRTVLTSRWQSAFQSDPPIRLHIGLLRGVLAWQAQFEAQFEAQWKTHGLQAPAHSRPTSNQAAQALRPGTRLLREWHGATHEVLVLSHGLEYGGKTYRSLSAVARAITGTHWSGPIFFGIKSSTKQKVES